tara:strand:+ start:7031 stop:7933 length:903 start_codon:yes stop_codon:yes gene_type:complete
MPANNIPVIGLVLHFRTPEKTLACLRAQQHEKISKVVVVDNSEDEGESVAVMQKGLEDLSRNDFDIKIVPSDHNLGFAGGVNLGLAYIKTLQPCHVLLINSDATLGEGSLHHMRGLLEKSTIVAPRILQDNQTLVSPFSYYDRLLGLITCQPKLSPLRYASGCCLLIHYNLAKNELFDQDYFFYGEDVMLAFNTNKYGIKIIECSEAIVRHSTSSSSKNGSMFYEYHINRSHWLLAKKLARNPLERYTFIAARCISLPIRALIRSLRSGSLVAWRALRDATIDFALGKCRSLTPPRRDDT